MHQYNLIQKAINDHKSFSNGRLSYHPDYFWSSSQTIRASVVASWLQPIAILFDDFIVMPYLHNYNNVSKTTKVHINNLGYYLHASMNLNVKYVPVLNSGIWYESGRAESVDNKYFVFPSEQYLEYTFDTNRKHIRYAKQYVKKTLSIGNDDFVTNVGGNLMLDDFTDNGISYDFNYRYVIDSEITDAIKKVSR